MKIFYSIIIVSVFSMSAAFSQEKEPLISADKALFMFEDRKPFNPIETSVESFSGTIEVNYPDGSTVLARTGEEFPPLENGVILKVLADSNITLTSGRRLNYYGPGALIRVLLRPPGEGRKDAQYTINTEE